MKTFAGIILLLINGLITWAYPPNNPVGVEMYFHPSTKDAFQANEDVFIKLVIKNHTSKPLFFNLKYAWYDSLDTFIPVQNTKDFLVDSIYQPQVIDLKDCLGESGIVVRPKDTLVFLQKTIPSCKYGGCMNYLLKPKNTYKVKIIAAFEDASHIILNKNVRIEERDERAWQSLESYWQKHLGLKKTNREEAKKYASRDYMYLFPDTCSYIVAKERMLESIIYTCFTSIEDPRDITFLKKNIYSIQDKDILLSILYILVGKVMRQADSHPAGNSVSNRQDLFKEITQTLKSMDNQLAYAWFGYIFNSNKGSEKQKRCFPTAWKASYYLTQQELNELEQIIKK